MNAEMIERMVELVLQSLRTQLAKQEPYRVLTVFSGTGGGFGVGKEAVRRLSDAGHHTVGLLSPTAVQLFGMDSFIQMGFSTLYAPGDWVPVTKLTRNIDLVLVPTLTMNLAAQLRAGLLDSPIVTAVGGALLAGLPVIAVRDGADPAVKAGTVFADKLNATSAYIDVFAANLNSLSDLGVCLVPEGEFLNEIDARLFGTKPLNTPAVSSANTLGRTDGAFASASNSGIYQAKGWLTAGMLQQYEPGTSVVVPDGLQITPLAREAARNRNLTLVGGSGRGRL